MQRSEASNVSDIDPPPERVMLDSEQQAEKVGGELARIAKQMVPVLLASIAAADGKSGSKIIIDIVFTKKGRLKVAPRMTVNSLSTEYEMLLVETKDGKQLQMFGD